MQKQSSISPVVKHASRESDRNKNKSKENRPLFYFLSVWELKTGFSPLLFQLQLKWRSLLVCAAALALCPLTPSVVSPPVSSCLVFPPLGAGSWEDFLGEAALWGHWGSVRGVRILFGDYIAKGYSREVKNNSFDTHVLHWALAPVWMSRTYCPVLTSDSPNLLVSRKGGSCKNTFYIRPPGSDLEFIYCHATGSSLNLALARRGGSQPASQRPAPLHASWPAPTPPLLFPGLCH